MTTAFCFMRGSTHKLANSQKHKNNMDYVTTEAAVNVSSNYAYLVWAILGGTLLLSFRFSAWEKVRRFNRKHHIILMDDEDEGIEPFDKFDEEVDYDSFEPFDVFDDEY